MKIAPILRSVSSELGREPADVPTPIDFLTMRDAQEWENKAMLRPYREDFFAAFADELQAIDKPDLRILELGSGPGFLAHHLLSKIPGAMQNDQRYMSLDEQRFCLESSGYEVTDVLIKGGRALYRATCIASELDALRR